MHILLVQFFFQPTIDVDLGAVRHGNMVFLGGLGAQAQEGPGLPFHLIVVFGW